MHCPDYVTDYSVCALLVSIVLYTVPSLFYVPTLSFGLTTPEERAGFKAEMMGVKATLLQLEKKVSSSMDRRRIVIIWTSYFNTLRRRMYAFMYK